MNHKYTKTKAQTTYLTLKAKRCQYATTFDFQHFGYLFNRILLVRRSTALCWFVVQPHSAGLSANRILETFTF